MEILFFEPVYKDYIWGGVRLKEYFKKQVQTPIVAESWEISTNDAGLSKIQTGQTLKELFEDETVKEEIFGTKTKNMREFPLLIKFIDAKDKEDLLNYFKETNIPNLYVMPSGDVPPNPSELLVSEKTTTLINGLKNMFDIVIFDGTPSLIVTDSLILARQVDATLIVTSYKSTKIGDIEKIKKSIENVGGNIAGIVINKIPISAKKYENSYYYGHRTNSVKHMNVQEKQNKMPPKGKRVRKHT